ncbi:calcium-binding protein [Zooshikella harenae]|uniref:Uncharacterized protein n=1 Tax=Zooshikella harenae TaxID=2827238 RepID=A0ABS5ZIE4_9GAMM|nr:calcium-binding protein [Zooshikella harenae]MBU2712782.1 hypothetical protein [Zooshikella harenae]
MTTWENPSTEGLQRWLTDTYDVSITAIDEAGFKWKVQGGSLPQTMRFVSLTDAKQSLEKGFIRRRSKHLAWLFRKLRGRNGHTLHSLGNTESGPVVVIDGGDDLAVSLENSGLPRKLVQAVQATGLYPGFIAVVHKGWLGAMEERNEASETLSELKNKLTELQEELISTLKTELEWKHQLIENQHLSTDQELIIKHLQFKKALFQQFQILTKNDQHPVNDQLIQLNDLITLITSERHRLQNLIHSPHSHQDNYPNALKKLLTLLSHNTIFDPKSPQTQDTLQKLAEYRSLHEERWLSFVESRLAANFTESGLSSMYWGMLAFESRATTQLLSGNATLPLSETMGVIGDGFNVIGQSQMVLAGLAKAGIGIHETKSIQDWLHTLRNNDLLKSDRSLKEVSKIIDRFYSNQRNAHIVDTFGSTLLTAGQLCMILGGPYGIGISALLFTGVGATIGGVGFSQAMAQYMNRTFNLIETPTDTEKAILTREAETNESLRSTLLRRINDLYHFAKDQAPARVWQKIYRQIIKNPELTVDKLFNKLHKQLNKGNDHYRQLYKEALAKIEQSPDDIKLIDHALKLAKSKSTSLDSTTNLQHGLTQWDLFNQISGHLKALHNKQPYQTKSLSLTESVEQLFAFADELGFGHDLERRIVSYLVNDTAVRRKLTVNTSDYISEISAVKNKLPWNIPNPLSPIIHVIELVRGPRAEPIRPLFRISWGHKKTSVLMFEREKFLNDLQNPERLSPTAQEVLYGLFFHKEGISSLFGHDSRSAFASALNSLGKRILRSNMLRPIMHGIRNQVELSELLFPILEAESHAKNRLGLSSYELSNVFLAAGKENITQAITFAANHNKLTVLSHSTDHQKQTDFIETIRTLPAGDKNTLANGQKISQLINKLRDNVNNTANHSSQLLELSINDRVLAIIQYKNHLVVYDPATAQSWQLPKLSSLKTLLIELGLNKQPWQLNVYQPARLQQNHVSSLQQLTKTYIPEWETLLLADQRFGHIALGEHKLSRIDLWQLGITHNNQLISANELATLTNLNLLENHSLSLNAEHIEQLLKQVNGDQADHLLSLTKTLLVPDNESLSLTLSGNETTQQRLNSRLNAIQQLDQASTKLNEINDQLSNTIKHLQSIEQHAKTFYAPQQHGKHKLQRLTEHLSRINLGLQLSRLPGGLYQTLTAAHEGDTYNASREGIAVSMDTLDVTLDVLANSRRIQSLSSRLSSVARKLGAFTNFVGAGIGTWYAVDAFKTAANTQGDERIDAIVSGSLAVAGTIISVVTGIASLVSATAGPIGVAIGLAISIAQGIYNAVRVTQNLRSAGISEGDLWRTGVAVFFGFPVPEDVQNKAAHNQTFAAYQVQMNKQFEQLQKNGIDKLVYSEGHIETSYGKVIGGISGRHDYYQLSPEQMARYNAHKPPYAPGHVFGQSPKPALVKALDNLNPDGTTLIMLGNGYDMAQGDLNRRNIFQVSGWGRKHLYGGNKNDIFELLYWRHGEGNIDNGRSEFIGGQGEDTFSIRNYFSSPPKGSHYSVNINLTEGSGRTSHTYGFIIKDIEHLIGSDHNDQFIGNAKDNTLTGFAGNDKLVGNEGNDHLAGGEGDDQLEGGKGHDSYIIQTQDIINSNSIDTINNYDNHYQKNWQELYDDYYDSAKSLRDRGISYLSDGWQHTIDFQAKHHADYHTQHPQTDLPTHPTTDFLITNLSTISAKKSAKNEDLILQVDTSWLISQRIQHQISALLQSTSSSATFKQKAQKIIKQQLAKYNLSTHYVRSWIDTLASHSSKVEYFATLEDIHSFLTSHIKEKTQFATIKNYFKGHAYQHISLMDTLGNHYNFSESNYTTTDSETYENNPIVVDSLLLSHSNIKDQTRVDLSHHTLQFDQQAIQSILSQQINHVKGSQVSDIIKGNQQSNMLVGDAGVDQLYGEAGDDILVLGKDGGLAVGGQGADTYQITTDDSHSLIDTRATDEQMDSIQLISGQNSSFKIQSVNSQIINANYGNTQLTIKHTLKNNQYLALVINNSQSTHEGEQHYTLNNKGDITLQLLDLSQTSSTHYRLDLEQNCYTWYQSGKQGSVKLCHYNAFKKSSTLTDSPLTIKLSDNDDYVKLSHGVFMIEGGQGNDNYTLDNTYTTLVLNNQQIDNGLDTIHWQSLDLKHLSVQRNEQSLILQNAAHEQQAIILKGWFNTKHDMVIEDRHGKQHQVSQLAHAISNMPAEHDSSLTSTSNNINSNNNVLTATAMINRLP